MAVKIRLMRLGRKKRPSYRIVAVDSRRRRDGVYLERVGFYDPIKRPAEVQIDHDVALKWLNSGAKPSDTVRSLFQREGVLLRWDMTKRNYDQEKIEEAVIKHVEHRYSKLNTEAPEKPVVEDLTTQEEVEEKKAKPTRKPKKSEAMEEKPAAEEVKQEEVQDVKAEETPEPEEKKADDPADEAETPAEEKQETKDEADGEK